MSNSLIYVIDDNHEFRESVSWMLEGAGYLVQKYGDPAIALKKIEKSSDDFNVCCLLDIRMPKMSGIEFHDRLLSIDKRIPIIYMSGHGDIPLAVEVMNKGAITFLEKPLNKILLKRAISKALIKSAEDRDKCQINKTEPYHPEVTEWQIINSEVTSTLSSQCSSNGSRF